MTASLPHRLVFPSPIGLLTLESDGNHLTALSFGDHGGADAHPLLQEAQKQLEAYFRGELSDFTLPLLDKGTAFQRRVWAALREIPYGDTISYRELAQRAGCPKGFRAVGRANGSNPLPILIPCHRVIARDGGLGGYSGGTHIKTFLLEMEARHT